MITVLLFGTFDGVHPGHGDFFRQAREFGDRVIVVIARDATVVAVKGQLPANSEEERRKMVAWHRHVDEAVLGREDDKHAIIAEIRPDVIFLGYDQEHFTQGLESYLSQQNIRAKIIRGEPFEPEIWKTSLLHEPEVREEQEVGLPM